MPSKECPACGLYNHETALQCDCGHDFQSGQIQSSSLSATTAMPYTVERRIKILLKWGLLVSLNAISSFIAAYLTEHDTFIHITAMLLGIFKFIIIYTMIDFWASYKKLGTFKRSLQIGVMIKMLLQLIPAIELTAGYIAASFIMGFLNIERGFIYPIL